MLIIKRITIIFSLLAGLVLIGHFLPMTLNVTPKKLLSNYSYRGQRLSKPKSVNPEIKDTTDYLSLLQQSLNVTKVKKNSHSLTWLVSNGIDLPVHAVNLSSALKSLHCQLTNAVENNRKPAELSTQFICPDKKTYAVTLRIGDNYSDAIAQLSIIFKADNTISIENMQRLDELNIPYTLIVDPYEESQTIYYDIKKLKSEFETLLLIPMEPINYPYVNPGEKALYIHNTSDEIEDKLDIAYNKLPDAVGITTINGTRAIVHNKLLNIVLGYIAEKGNVFIDLTRSSRSKAAELCSEYRMSCPRLRYYTYADIDRYLDKSISITQKKGEHSIALPLTTKNLDAVKRIISKSKENGVTFVKLSSLS